MATMTFALAGYYRAPHTSHTGGPPLNHPKTPHAENSTRAHTHTHTHTPAHIHKFLPPHTPAHMHTRSHIHIPAPTHTRSHTYPLTYAHPLRHTPAYLYTPAHILSPALTHTRSPTHTRHFPTCTLTDKTECNSSIVAQNIHIIHV